MSNLPDYLGTYRRSRFIRAGNACQIWEAMKGDGGRYILKILRRENWGKSQEMAYLKHEYEVAHPLEHPNIIRIYEYCQEGKIAYLVLELFAELNLKQALRADHARILSNFSQIFEQSASSLQHLHDHKWVHCDVKPDNFLLNDDCQIKLIDFTIAKRISKNLLAKLFRKKAQIRGTRSYMSPEQIRGKPLDARADIYSYGCVVFELLTNKLPYTGVNPDDLLTRHLRSAIPSTLVFNNSVTNEMNELVRRMMAKDPENRPASMQEVLQEFRTLKPFKSSPKV